MEIKILSENKEEEEGMGTGLKPTKINLSAPKASEEVEAFLSELAKELLHDAWNNRKKNLETFKSSEVKDIQTQLKGDDNQVVVPTDKTSSFRVVKIKDYIKWVLKHLKKSAKEIDRERLIEVQKQAGILLEERRHVISAKEAEFIEQSIKSKAIPSPKLLIKDHKDKPEDLDKDGNFPTRLVVPANNFTSAFPKLGYLGIKKILDDNGIEYSKKTIIQASDLKEAIQNQGINCGGYTIVSIDAKAFYPSVKFSLVRKAVHFYAKGLPEDDWIKIEQCLDMV